MTPFWYLTNKSLDLYDPVRARTLHLLVVNVRTDTIKIS